MTGPSRDALFEALLLVLQIVGHISHLAYSLRNILEQDICTNTLRPFSLSFLQGLINHVPPLAGVMAVTLPLSGGR